MKTRTIVILIVTLSIAFAAGVIAMCAGFFIFTFRNLDRSVSPEIDSLFAAISDDTLGDTYETQTSPEFRQVVTRGQFEDLGRTIRTRLGGLKSKRITQFNVRQVNASSFANVSYDAEFEKGKGAIVAQFKSSGGKWLVVNFTVTSPEFQKDFATGTCPDCQAPHASSAKFCPNCGKALAPSESNGETESNGPGA